MYTWGQLRYQLQTGAPGTISPDLFDEWLNVRYAAILDHYPWKGLEVSTFLQTVASYATGTVLATLGSTAVTGVGTTWTAGMTGYRIQIAGGALYVFTYLSATTGTLSRAYEGATSPAGGDTFTIFQNIYNLPSDCKTVLELDSAVDGTPLQEFSKKAISDAIGLRVLVGDPSMYAIDADGPEASPPVLHTVELYPLPKTAYGLPLRYQKAALAFTGDSPGASPLPFVSQQCLLNGCRADIAMHLEKFSQAQMYEAKFESDLRDAVRLDGMRKGPKSLQLEPHYTNYRRLRVSR